MPEKKRKKKKKGQVGPI